MSSRDMTINQIKAADKNFGAKHTIVVKGFNGGGRVTTAQVLEITTKMIKELAIEMRAGFKQINDRIDNLVFKNNLKE